jgi:hypothetical protein
MKTPMPAALAFAAIACSGPPPLPPPVLTIDEPSPGAVVAPGQEVRFRLDARGAGTFAYELSRVGGGAVARAEAAGVAEVAWVVPLDAPPGQRIEFEATARHLAIERIARARTHVEVGGARPAATGPRREGSPREWEGTFVLTGGGNIYDDEVRAEFTFDVARDGGISGKGSAVLAARDRAVGGCRYIHTQTPASFPVSVTGRREGDRFALRLAGRPAMGSRVTRTDCGAAGGSTGAAVPFPAFGAGAVVPGALAPKVRAEDGASETTRHDADEWRVAATTTVRRRR